MKSIPFDGLLFDLDGTLADSIPAVINNWTAWAERKGLDPEYVLSRIHGRPAIESIAELLEGASEAEIQAEFEYLEQYEATHTDGTVPLEGSLRLLNTLNECNIPWAIVTSGTLPVAKARIAAAGLPIPKVLITPERLSQGKPHPEPYLTGAKELGVDANKCLCFEDAHAGVVSGKAANCTVIAVLSHATKQELPEADYYISAPQDVTVTVNEHGFTLNI